MPRASRHGPDGCGPLVDGGPGARQRRETDRLLRFSHIFASTVRDVLDRKLLREISPVLLTRSQFRLLKLMTLDGQRQVGEVAGFLGMSPPAVTKNIDKLENLGFMIRTRSQGDRRATLLSVSPKGRRLVLEYEALRASRLAPVLGRFRPTEIEQLTGLLERFAITVLEHEGSVTGPCLRCGAFIEPGCPVGRLRGGCPYEKPRAETVSG